jgi:hypothetical protein
MLLERSYAQPENIVDRRRRASWLPKVHGFIAFSSRQ